VVNPRAQAPTQSQNRLSTRPLNDRYPIAVATFPQWRPLRALRVTFPLKNISPLVKSNSFSLELLFLSSKTAPMTSISMF
jgi:hypothetical protein